MKIKHEENIKRVWVERGGRQRDELLGGGSMKGKGRGKVNL